MRVLVAIPHYCGPKAGNRKETYGSNMGTVGRLAALSEQIVALHRHFGPGALAGPSGLPQSALEVGRVLDIVIVTKAGCHVLDWLNIDKSLYSVEMFTGDPLMLSFETQRVLRERAGGYDLYATMEDDLIIHDREFLDKIVWFQETFGEHRVLQPHRYELSKSASLAKIYIEATVEQRHPEFVRAGQERMLNGSWHGRRQSFRLADNPHSGCAFVTQRQLVSWLAQPTFYDRNPAWIGPLESAATRSLAMTFDVYRAEAPDAAFLEIEHYGTRYAAEHVPKGVRVGNSPIQALAQEQLAGGAGCSPDAAEGANGALRDKVSSELADLRRENMQLHKMLRSRGGLFRHWLSLMTSKKAQ